MNSNDRLEIAKIIEHYNDDSAIYVTNIMESTNGGGNKMIEEASGASRDEVTRAENYLIRA